MCRCSCDRPLFDEDPAAYVYTGQGLNIQTSYLFNCKWEVALRNSTLFPDREIHPLAGYRNRNQTTLGITRYIIGHSLKCRPTSRTTPMPGATRRSFPTTTTAGSCVSNRGVRVIIIIFFIIHWLLSPFYGIIEPIVEDIRNGVNYNDPFLL